VVLRGEVADLSAEYGSASVVLVPLRTGSGLKVKIVEAICAGVPVVTTAVGAQGLGALSPRPFVLADGPSEFSDGLVQVLTDGALRADLAAAARTAAPRFSPDAAFADLDQALRDAGVALPPPGEAAPAV
jgi:glycosyltransferase involved in cell wall biosynthesis